MSDYMQNFDLTNGINILRLICGLFFIPHIYAKFFVPEALGFFVAAKFDPPKRYMYVACVVEIIISAGYSTFSHALKGNVDIVVALVMHTGAAVGAQIGAILTQFIRGPKIRLAFVPLPLVGAAIVIYPLVTGQKL